MAKLLSHLWLTFKSLGYRSAADSERAAKLELICLELVNSDLIHLAEQNPAIRLPWEAISMRLPEHRLQHIIQQVKIEGYHVESLATFDSCDNLNPGSLILAIESWASDHALKLSVNHERQLCFFEKI